MQARVNFLWLPCFVRSTTLSRRKYTIFVCVIFFSLAGCSRSNAPNSPTSPSNSQESKLPEGPTAAHHSAAPNVGAGQNDPKVTAANTSNSTRLPPEKPAASSSPEVISVVALPASELPFGHRSIHEIKNIVGSAEARKAGFPFFSKLLPLNDHLILLQGTPTGPFDGGNDDAIFFSPGHKEKQPDFSLFSKNIEQGFATTSEGVFANSTRWSDIFELASDGSIRSTYKFPRDTISNCSGFGCGADVGPSSNFVQVGHSQVLAQLETKQDHLYSIAFFDTKTKLFTLLDLFKDPKSMGLAQLVSSSSGQLVAIGNRDWRGYSDPIHLTFSVHVDSKSHTIHRLMVGDMLNALGIPLPNIQMINLKSYAFDEGGNTLYMKVFKRTFSESIGQDALIAWNLTDGTLRPFPVTNADETDYCDGDILRVESGQMLCNRNNPKLTDLTTLKVISVVPTSILPNTSEWQLDPLFFSSDFKMAFRTDDNFLYVIKADSIDPKQWIQTKLPYSKIDLQNDISSLNRLRSSEPPHIENAAFSSDNKTIVFSSRNVFWEVN